MESQFVADRSHTVFPPTRSSRAMLQTSSLLIHSLFLSLFLSLYAQIFLVFLVSYFCYYLLSKATVKHTNTHYNSQKKKKIENNIVKEMFAILQIPFIFVYIYTYKEKHIIFKKNNNSKIKQKS